ncbi:thioredoxin fold domain-containing protein [Sulfurihydrogenibium subterraneum]|uniref:thioredoxin fold domain-containing protein n=1 Tax=Sulfurihydrogenibium subterraneum TaxID=171121 RepID=UPI00048B6B74|nr:thioredoxin fold domain-containing protein [Sulfurihydrogenibium subterraneum]
MKKSAVALLSVAVALSAGCQSKKQEKQLNFDCPKEDKIVEVIKKFTPNNEIIIEKVEKFRNVNLCQVEFRIGIKPAVFYVNEDLSLLFPAVIDGKTGENIAIKSIQQRRDIPEKLLEKFENYVFFTVGKGSRYVYFITDPDCKVCEDSYKTLEAWALEKNVKVKIIIRPLAIHQNSYDIALSVFCDKKGFEDILKGYNSKRSCEEGRKKLDETIKFIDEKMAMSDITNPIVISDKGKILNAFITKENLNWLLQ